METLKVSTIAEQVTEHLRGELEKGRWTGLMPGRDRLARELGVNRKTVEAALVRLEGEGVLKAQGAGRRRLIQLETRPRRDRTLRIGILFHDAIDREQGYLIALQHELQERGHSLEVARRHLVDLEMDPTRVARLVQRGRADAWIVTGGSLDVLERMVSIKKPVFAMFGRRRELLIPGVGPDKPLAYAAATRELIRLGHRRIVLLCPPDRRIPEPGASERAFLAELAAHEVPLSRFQLPDWKDSIEDLHRRLELLFRVTPPTALIVDEIRVFAAVQSFLARKGVRVPKDVSLVCTEYEGWFDWCRPTIAHMRWDTSQAVRRVVGWAANVGAGRRDLRQLEVPVEFVPGGTIGRAPR